MSNSNSTFFENGGSVLTDHFNRPVKSDGSFPGNSLEPIQSPSFPSLMQYNQNPSGNSDYTSPANNSNLLYSKTSGNSSQLYHGDLSDAKHSSPAVSSNVSGNNFCLNMSYNSNTSNTSQSSNNANNALRNSTYSIISDTSSVSSVNSLHNLRDYLPSSNSNASVIFDQADNTNNNNNNTNNIMMNQNNNNPYALSRLTTDLPINDIVKHNTPSNKNTSTQHHHLHHSNADSNSIYANTNFRHSLISDDFDRLSIADSTQSNISTASSGMFTRTSTHNGYLQSLLLSPEAFGSNNSNNSNNSLTSTNLSKNNASNNNMNSIQSNNINNSNNNTMNLNNNNNTNLVDLQFLQQQQQFLQQQQKQLLQGQDGRYMFVQVPNTNTSLLQQQQQHLSTSHNNNTLPSSAYYLSNLHNSNNTSFDTDSIHMLSFSSNNSGSLCSGSSGSSSHVKKSKQVTNAHWKLKPCSYYQVGECKKFAELCSFKHHYAYRTEPYHVKNCDQYRFLLQAFCRGYVNRNMFWTSVLALLLQITNETMHVPANLFHPTTPLNLKIKLLPAVVISVFSSLLLNWRDLHVAKEVEPLVHMDYALESQLEQVTVLLFSQLEWRGCIVETLTAYYSNYIMEVSNMPSSNMLSNSNVEFFMQQLCLFNMNANNLNNMNSAMTMNSVNLNNTSVGMNHMNSMNNNMTTMNNTLTHNNNITTNLYMPTQFSNNLPNLHIVANMNTQLIGGLLSNNNNNNNTNTNKLASKKTEKTKKPKADLVLSKPCSYHTISVCAKQPSLCYFAHHPCLISLLNPAHTNFAYNPLFPLIIQGKLPVPIHATHAVLCLCLAIDSTTLPYLTRAFHTETLNNGCYSIHSYDKNIHISPTHSASSSFTSSFDSVDTTALLDKLVTYINAFCKTFVSKGSHERTAGVVNTSLRNHPRLIWLGGVAVEVIFNDIDGFFYVKRTTQDIPIVYEPHMDDMDISPCVSPKPVVYGRVLTPKTQPATSANIALEPINGSIMGVYTCICQFSENMHNAMSRPTKQNCMACNLECTPKTYKFLNVKSVVQRHYCEKSEDPDSVCPSCPVIDPQHVTIMQYANMVANEHFKYSIQLDIVCKR